MALLCQIFRQVVSCAQFLGNELRSNALQDGGEGGIRTHQDHLESVTYRNHVAAIAMNAAAAVAHCPPLPADSLCPASPRRRCSSPIRAIAALVQDADYDNLSARTV